MTMKLTISRFLLALLAVAGSFAAVAQTATESVRWISVEEAFALQKTDPKPIMMDVYTHWCGPCKMMAQKTFTNPDVAAYLNEHYYSVKFNAESPDTIHFQGNTYTNPTYNPEATGRNGVHEFSRFLNVTAYPTLVFFDPQATYLGPVVGYKTPMDLEIFLKLFASGDYKGITTAEEWQAYQQKFTPSWTN